ncbi:MAG: glutamyl-tRNA reductase [Deltaproteobacteria bacterium]|nr:glutamyl-tRNA reductase [Deltaproteobacteria bacterium]
MREIFVIGLSHHGTPIEIRERLSVATGSAAEEVRGLLGSAPLAEGVLLSTCNRVELYAASDDPIHASRAVRKYLESRADDAALGQYLYEHTGEDAVRHAFRVASSLDSMVVGEPQILGQVKDAYQAAESAGGLGTLLGRCFTRAFAVAKRVRTETDVAAGTVSISSIAIELASKIFGDLSGRRAMLLGAGEMGEAAAKSLVGRGVRLVVVNRSPERAERLAKSLGAEAAPYEQLTTELTKADVVITSTASARFVITKGLMKDVMKARKRRPLFLIDIAVPRDIDPRAGDLGNVFLYDVDDLSEVAGVNLAARKRAADQAEGIVRAETDNFEQWRRSLALSPTIKGLRERFLSIARAELERTLPRLDVSEHDQEILDAMVNAIVNKLLHRPMTELKHGANAPDAAHLIDATRRLFDLAERRSLPPLAPGSEGSEEAQTDTPAIGELAAVSSGSRGENR